MEKLNFENRIEISKIFKEKLNEVEIAGWVKNIRTLGK